MRIVVIGGTRFIGPAVVRMLRAAGHELLLVHRGAAEPCTEQHGVPHLHGDYDKILVERAFAQCPDLPATVLRLPMVHGPGDYQHRTRGYLRRMLDGRPGIVLDERTAALRATRAYVDGIAAAVVLALTDQRAAGRAYNVGDPEPWPEPEWVRAIGAAAGWDGDVAAVPAEALPPSLRAGLEPAQELVMDTGRIRRELGYAEVTPREEGVARAVAWERARLADAPDDPDDEAVDYGAEDLALRTWRSGAR